MFTNVILLTHAKKTNRQSYIQSWPVLSEVAETVIHLLVFQTFMKVVEKIESRNTGQVVDKIISNINKKCANSRIDRK